MTPDSKPEVSISSSRSYHAFGIPSYKYARTRYVTGQVVFTIRTCPRPIGVRPGGFPRSSAVGHVERYFQSLPIGSHATAVALPVLCVARRDCGVVLEIDMALVDASRNGTQPSERGLLELLRRMIVRNVAAYQNVEWGLGKAISKCDLSRR